MKKNIMLSVLVIAAFVFSGCMESNTNTQYDKVTCTGKSLEADCIVTFYEDNSNYLSEQHHKICLSSPFIEVTADEPTGSVGSKLSGSDFYVKKPVPNNIKPIICDSIYAKMLLTFMTIGDIGWTELNTIPNEKVNILGNDYIAATIKPLVVNENATTEPAKKTIISVHSVPWAEITIFGNVRTKLIDRISIKNPKSGAELSAYGFNWRKIKEINKQVPTKIDVYSSNVWDIDVPKSLQISYLDFTITESKVLE